MKEQCYNNSSLLLALFASSDISRLIKEISVMLSFNHPNVMTLRGVCLDQESPLLIMPFMSNGSVLEYVRKNKVELMYVEEPDAVKVLIIVLYRMPRKGNVTDV